MNKDITRQDRGYQGLCAYGHMDNHVDQSGSCLDRVAYVCEMQGMCYGL